MSNTIFVQIASYRDPQLLPTIYNCLERSAYPENLTFGICYQDESFSAAFDKDSRFNIIKIPYQESQGTCWARSKTNELYSGERFTLQIDSHMRFVKNWDKELIEMWNNLNDPKAVLTSYPSEFLPEQREDEWKQNVHVIHTYAMKDGHTQQRPRTPVNFSQRTTPYKARHVAAGFIFAPGSIITDVPYDPEFYFGGEETALAVRLFTHGYNLFHPHKLLLWHYYGRKDEPKHWSDHKDWGKNQIVAKDRLNCLLKRNTKFDLGKYGLGTIRTLEDFQNYSGIDYKRNVLHLDTIDDKEPPVDLTNAYRWSYDVKKFKQTMTWDYKQIDNSESHRFWAFIVLDQNDHSLFRKDIKYADNPDLLDGKITELEIEFEYYSPAQVPKKFYVWPYANSMKWLNKTIFEIA